MLAGGRVCRSPAFRRSHGRWHLTDYAWLLFIFLSTANDALALLPVRPPIPPPVDRFFYNGTYASTTCQNKFTCRSVGADLSECSCHAKCALFDECCQDARPTNWRQMRLPPDAYECTRAIDGDYSVSPLKLSGQSFFYVITKCPPSFGNPLLRAYCEQSSHLVGNGTLPAIVTDVSSGLTFANKFCAYCNGADVPQAVSWDVQKVCLDEPSVGLTGCEQRWIKPNITVTLPECKWSYVRSCPPNASSMMQAACTDNPVQRIYDDKNRVVYRNYNCSLCYSIDNPSWSCTQKWLSSWALPISADLQALLAVYNCPKQLTTFATAEERMFWRYACPDITFNRGNCSDTLTMTGLTTLYDSNPTDEYEITPEGVWLRYNSSYAACARCQPSNLTAIANYSNDANSTLRNITVNGTTYSMPFFKIGDSDSVAVCSPQPFDLPSEKCTDLPSIISEVFMALSLFGLTLYAVAYGMLQSLQNLPGQIVLHQSVAFFAAFLAFLLRVPAGAVSDGACIALGVLSHFFFLAAFTWTAVYAIEVVRALGLQAYGSGFTKRRIRYVITGWLVPTVIIVAAIATDWATSENLFRPAYGRPQCFIYSQYGHRIFFTAPLALFMLIDVVIYVYVIIKLVIISGQTKMVREAHHEKLFLAAKLVFALGITWIFAVLASTTGDCILVYIFTLLNSLQGVFVFVIFVCNAKTTGQLHKKLKSHKSLVSSAGTGSTLSVRDFSSSSSTSILPKRKTVLGVNSFSPVSQAMDAHANESVPPR